MRRAITALTLIFACAALAPSVRAQGVAPAPGVDMPPEVKQSMEGKGKFQFQHAWIENTRKIRETLEPYIDERGFYKRDMIQATERPQYSVSGNFNVPVFCVKYSTTGADPFPI